MEQESILSVSATSPERPSTRGLAEVVRVNVDLHGKEPSNAREREFGQWTGFMRLWCGEPGQRAGRAGDSRPVKDESNWLLPGTNENQA